MTRPADPTEAALRLTQAAAQVRAGRVPGRAVVAELARAVADVCRLRGLLAEAPPVPCPADALADFELALRRARAAGVPWTQIVRAVNGGDDE